LFFFFFIFIFINLVGYFDLSRKTDVSMTMGARTWFITSYPFYYTLFFFLFRGFQAPEVLRSRKFDLIYYSLFSHFFMIFFMSVLPADTAVHLICTHLE
jgi:hypothetical protein